MRSKSEKILADIFFDLGIIYKYECPIEFSNGYMIYPDFTFLSPYTNEEVYWEHHGLMDDNNYLDKTLKKIAYYEKNGIFRGKNLIITYESSRVNLDQDWVIALLEEYLIL